MAATMRQLEHVQNAKNSRQEGQLVLVLGALHPKVEARIRRSLQGLNESHGVHVISIMGEVLDGQPALFGIDGDEEQVWPLLDYAMSLDEPS
jgi:hypothetical protein